MPLRNLYRIFNDLFNAFELLKVGRKWCFYEWEVVYLGFGHVRTYTHSRSIDSSFVIFYFSLFKELSPLRIHDPFYLIYWYDQANLI